MRLDGPDGSVAFDDHVVEVVGGARRRVSRLAVSGLLDIVRQTDKLDALVAAIDERR